MNTLIFEQAANLVRRFEGFSSHPYRCPAGYWTIGYGHRCSATQGAVTVQQAEAWLFEDLSAVFSHVVRLIPDIEVYPYRAAALISWTFNLGHGALARSTMRKKLLKGDIDAAVKELRRWDKITVNGRKNTLHGLTRRREAEAELLAKAETEPLFKKEIEMEKQSC